MLRAIAHPTIDHRGEEFRQLTGHLLERLPRIFDTNGPVVAYPASGTGAWEAALVNTLSPGDRVLAFDIGHFAALWAQLARSLHLDVTLVPGDWRSGVDATVVAELMAEDHAHEIAAIQVLHNETSTGVTSDIAAVRAALDAAGHPALLLVDTVSSLAAMEYRHDEWGVDVTVAGSQKGLMLPPGLSFNAISQKALAASARARLPRSYWAWGPILEANRQGVFPYTPPTNLLFGLDVALDLLLGEGLPNVFARHARLAEATRHAVEAWGLEFVARDPCERSDSLTACFLPRGVSDPHFREVLHDDLGVTIGAGLGRLAGEIVRIGHLGDLSPAMLLGTLGAFEAALGACGHHVQQSGVASAVRFLARETGVRSNST